MSVKNDIKFKYWIYLSLFGKSSFEFQVEHKPFTFADFIEMQMCDRDSIIDELRKNVYNIHI